MIAWSDVAPGLRGLYNYVVGFASVYVSGSAVADDGVSRQVLERVPLSWAGP